MLKAIPTVCLLLILHFYLKAVLFKPLQKILNQRDELTEGARKAAQQSLDGAEKKQQEYEAKFRDARAEVYRGLVVAEHTIFCMIVLSRTNAQSNKTAKNRQESNIYRLITGNPSFLFQILWAYFPCLEKLAELYN